MKQRLSPEELVLYGAIVIGIAVVIGMAVMFFFFPPAPPIWDE